MKKIFTSVFILSAALTYAQSTLKGKITDQNQQPIVGAEVFWQSSDISVITDEKGNFEIENYQPTSILGVFYENETTTFKELKDEFQNITINVKDHFGDTTLGEVVVKDASSSLKKSKFATNMTTMTGKELLKAACCNLAESFETNPSIDVNFSDAVTGNKQIKMLGLTSPYILIAEENIPNVRGASQAFGLSFTPGTWVESIQVTKGAGTVINGYESISGQINTELIKPADDIPLFVNLYGSTDSRFEGNVHLNKKLNDKWSSSLFLHGNARVSENDMNDDGFLDNPLGHQVNVMNRWQYQNLEKGWVGFLSARYLNDRKQAGQVEFDKDRDKLTTNYWGSEINTNRVDVSSKIGYVFPEMPYQTMGLQTAFSYHKQDSYFGLNQYDIEQQSFYTNYIFSSIISNTKNKFSTGASFTYDKFKEFVALPTDGNYDRIDNSAGAFFEYTYDNMKNFNMIAGLRGDYHNRMGFFLTPRLHTRYTPVKGTTIKASVGRGKRTLSSTNRSFYRCSFYRRVTRMQTRRQEKAHSIVIISTKPSNHVEILHIIIRIFEESTSRIINSIIISICWKRYKFLEFIVRKTRSCRKFIFCIANNRTKNIVCIKTLLFDIILIQSKIRILFMITKRCLQAHCLVRHFWKNIANF